MVLTEEYVYSIPWEPALYGIFGNVCFPSILSAWLIFMVFLSFLSIDRWQILFPWQKWRRHRQLRPRGVVSCAGLWPIMSSVCWHFYQRQFLALRTINFFFTWPHNCDFMFCEGCTLPYLEALPDGWLSGINVV